MKMLAVRASHAQVGEMATIFADSPVTTDQDCTYQTKQRMHMVISIDKLDPAPFEQFSNVA